MFSNSDTGKIALWDRAYCCYNLLSIQVLKSFSNLPVQLTPSQVLESFCNLSISIDTKYKLLFIQLNVEVLIALLFMHNYVCHIANVLFYTSFAVTCMRMHKTVLLGNLLRWVQSLKDWKIWAQHCNLVLSSGTILNWEGHDAQPVLLHKQWGFWWLTNLLEFWHLTKWLHWTIFPFWLPPNKI